MSDQHWQKVMFAVEIYCQKNGIGPGDVQARLTLMQGKVAKLLDEDFLDNYIAKLKAQQDVDSMGPKVTAQQAIIDDLSEVDL